MEWQGSAHVCTPAPTVWPTPCTPVLRRASAPVMKVCTEAPPSSIRLASLSEAVGATCKDILFEIRAPRRLGKHGVVHAVMGLGAETSDGAPAVSPEYLFHSARTEAEGSSGPDCCPKMLLKKLLDMLPLAVRATHFSVSSVLSISLYLCLSQCLLYA